jgi:hypothetical protein
VATKKKETKVEVKKKTAVKQEVKEEKSSPTSKTYLLSYRKEDRKWQIIQFKGKKAIKLFDTKAEAEAYLKVLAKNQDANVSVKKKDGKFQKKR